MRQLLVALLAPYLLPSASAAGALRYTTFDWGVEAGTPVIAAPLSSQKKVVPLSSQKKLASVALTQREDVEGGRRLAGLLDVSRDLETDKQKDDLNLRQLESQIVGLVKQRNAIKRDEARKARELAFLHEQIGRASGQIGSSQAAAVETRQAAEAGAEEESKADTSVDAAIASADQVVKEATGSDVSVAAVSEQQQQAAQAAQVAQAAQAAAAAAQAQQQSAAAAQQRAAAEAAAAAEAQKKMRAEAEAAAEARLRAEAEAKAKVEAEAEAKARAKIEAEEKVKREAQEKKRREEEQRNAAERAAQEADRKKKEALADSADDSFKQFMKEEDGEDQMGDADYEDSANALAGAIGWDRTKIEKNADSAVKQLTQAIGGKKVVQSLQGMMAGIGR